MRLICHGKVIIKIVVGAERCPCIQDARCRVYECPITRRQLIAVVIWSFDRLAHPCQKGSGAMVSKSCYY